MMQNTNEYVFTLKDDKKFWNVERKSNFEKIGEKFIKKIYEHKWISLIICSLIILSSINGIMIYNFFKILQNI